MSAPRTEQSLEALLNEVVDDAVNWSNAKTTDLLASPETPADDGPAHPCFDQLTRAISSHVTELLMRRLRAGTTPSVLDAAASPSPDNYDTDDEDRPWMDEMGRERRGPRRGAGGYAPPVPLPPHLLDDYGGVDSLLSTPRSSPAASIASRDAPMTPANGPKINGQHQHRFYGTTPSGSGSSHIPRPLRKGDVGPPPAGGFTRYCSGGSSVAGSMTSLISEGGTRYHSENRLDRSWPKPRGGETPLENRASRLRRMSMDKKKDAEAARSRSAASTPLPARRALSRAGSGYVGGNAF